MTNRLNLDFSLHSTEERTLFIQGYLDSPQFRAKPPTESELELMANYILWGRSIETGTNVVQDKDIQIKTRANLWGKSNPVESLDSLMQSPGFNEQQILSPSAPKYKYVRTTFSRAQTRLELACNSTLLALFEDLWRRIDTLELELNYYDLAHAKRTKPPRAQLLARFSDVERAHLQQSGESLSQYKYLKKRHLLVELRREQFTLKDTYQPQLQQHQTQDQPMRVESYNLDADIPCAPIGLKYVEAGDSIWEKIFPTTHFPSPSDFTQNELARVMKFYWSRADYVKQVPNTFDFRNCDHINRTLEIVEQLQTDQELDYNILSNSSQFIDTLNFYIARADLNEIQRTILRAKLEKQSNVDIANLVNRDFGKTYSDNYISTIFHQQIIPAIAEAASVHAQIIENLPYPENFKKCRTCGQILLATTDNFVRKGRAPDGLSTQCKRCDRQARIIAKEKIKHHE